jgi:hypothetical protein
LKNQFWPSLKRQSTSPSRIHVTWSKLKFEFKYVHSIAHVEKPLGKFLGQTNKLSPRYEIFKKRAIFNFLKNPPSRILLLSQPFCDRFFWATSYLKAKRKLNKIEYFPRFEHHI